MEAGRHFLEDAMTIAERPIGTVVVLDLQGPLTLGTAADTLRDKVRSLLYQGQKQLIVNLGGVSHIDSAGLGELVRAFATTTSQGGTLKLVNLTKRLQNLLVITKLSNVFECFDDETSAVTSFRTRTEPSLL
jgi:anti-sigma B factor antagonist